jgi:xylose isomerase
MITEFFPEVKETIPYAGPSSRDPLSFRYYDASRRVGRRTMAQHLKFAVAYWHTFKGTGADPFGDAVYDRPWDRADDAMAVAHRTLEAAFEFFEKLGVRYYCFHDRDLAPAGRDASETRERLSEMVEAARVQQRRTGIRLLWGTANLFSHPRYTHGAATNPDPLVFAHAAAQVRQAIDATVRLGGSGYVFWGGREGYTTLLNTDMRREREQMARLLHMAVDHGRKQGFRGKFFLEPKAREPSLHQYDFDAAHTLNFLREFGLTDDFMLNIEANHASLATHTFEHELRTAADAGMLGSVDINRGEEGIGWDTDNFAMDLRECTLAMLVLLKQGGLRWGGLNFDAKVRRGSFDTLDLFYGHVGSMDAFAHALLVADRLRRDGLMQEMLNKRYSGFRRGFGRRILRGEVSLAEAEQWADREGEPELRSGRQELLETILNDYLWNADLD